MACINFGQLDTKLIPIIFGCVFCFFSRLLFNFVDTKYYDHEIISSLFCTTPKIFTFIPLIIFKYRTKRFNFKENINKDNFEGRLTQGNAKNNSKSRSKSKYLFLLLSSILYSSQSIILVHTIRVKTNTWILDILFTCLFYFLIFKIKLFRHHYLCIFLIILTDFESLCELFSKILLLI